MTGNEPEQSGPPAPCDPVRGRRRQQDEPELEGAAGQAARHAAAERKPLDPATRVTRPARGVVFPKIALTRHRAFRDGYRLSGKNRKVGSHDSFCAPGATGTSGARRIGTVLGRTGPGRSRKSPVSGHAAGRFYIRRALPNPYVPASVRKSRPCPLPLETLARSFG